MPAPVTADNSTPDQLHRVDALFAAFGRLIEAGAPYTVDMDAHLGDVRLMLTRNADGTIDKCYEALAFIGDTHLLETRDYLRSVAFAQAQQYMPREALDLCYRRLMGL